jgi:uncharacterized protein DUF3182
MDGKDRGVVVYLNHDTQTGNEHERETHRDIAARLAKLLHYEYDGDHEPGKHCAGAVYFVPAATLDDAHRLGIHSEQDIFGAVVPHTFVGTKTITHPLLEPRAHAPDGCVRCLHGGRRGGRSAGLCRLYT